jgi:hypothetical protein
MGDAFQRDGELAAAFEAARGTGVDEFQCDVQAFGKNEAVVYEDRSVERGAESLGSGARRRVDALSGADRDDAAFGGGAGAAGSGEARGRRRRSRTTELGSGSCVGEAGSGVSAGFGGAGGGSGLPGGAMVVESITCFTPRRVKSLRSELSRRGKSSDRRYL